MHFKLDYLLRQTAYIDEKPLKFSYGGLHHVTVLLRRLPKENLKPSYAGSNILCSATSSQEPSHKITSIFDDLAKVGVTSGLTGDSKTSKVRASVPARTEMPVEFQSFAQRVESKLGDFAERTVRVFRWRSGELGHHNPIRYVLGFSWQRDRRTWRAMPVDITLGIEASFPVWKKLPSEIPQCVAELVRGGADEPIGHVLFREAWDQRHENPRSALILGIAAAETGFKQFAAFLVPEARWLLEELPSPPLVRMLTEFLPMLPCKAQIKKGVVPPPKNILDTIKKGVDIRNQVIHGKPATLDREMLRDLLGAVRDVLYLLDLYSGQLWAQHYISHKTKEALC